MRQEVNLLTKEQQGGQLPISASMVAVSAGVFAVALILVSILTVYQQSTSEQKFAEAKKNNKTISLRLQHLKSSRPLSQRPQLLAEIQSLQHHVQRREQLKNIIGGQDFGNFAGFSNYLEALAARADVDTALTDIRILQAGQLLELEGWTRRPSAVPGYLYLLRSEAIMEHVKFGTLSIVRDEKRPSHSYFILGNINEDES